MQGIHYVNKVGISGKLQQDLEGGAICQEEMALDRPGADCVTALVGKPAGEDSGADKRDRARGPGAKRADARSNGRHSGYMGVKHKFIA
jgi:hypothetical protein